MLDKLPEEKKVIATTVARVSLNEDGIIYVRFPAENTNFLLEHAIENVNAIETLATGKKRPMLVDMRNIKNAGPGVRKYASSEEATRLLVANAMLVTSSVSPKGQKTPSTGEISRITPSFAGKIGPRLMS